MKPDFIVAERVASDAGPIQLVSYGVRLAAARTDLSELADKPSTVAQTLFGNCNTTIPLKFDFDGADTGHTVVIGPTDQGMSMRANPTEES